MIKADNKVAENSEIIFANLSGHELIAKWRTGSQEAAAILMDRYRLRLINLAQEFWSRAMQQVVISMGKKKKALPPRVKRMKRPARLASARKWIPTYNGKNLLRGYCNYYGVNWQCAAIELKTLGVQIDPEYLAMRERTEAEEVKKRQAKKQQRHLRENEHWHPYNDAFSAYMAGDYEALYDLENQEHKE